MKILIKFCLWERYFYMFCMRNYTSDSCQRLPSKVIQSIVNKNVACVVTFIAFFLCLCFVSQINLQSTYTKNVELYNKMVNMWRNVHWNYIIVFENNTSNFLAKLNDFPDEIKPWNWIITTLSILFKFTIGSFEFLWSL